MRKARNYIYRNLHKNKFSIRYKGIVQTHAHYLTAYKCEFKVNEAGRQRVLKEKRKNVHAFVSTESYYLQEGELDLSNKREVYYNPYKHDQFILKDTREVITRKDKVYFYNNKIYIKKYEGRDWEEKEIQ